MTKIELIDSSDGETLSFIEGDFTRDEFDALIKKLMDSPDRTVDDIFITLGNAGYIWKEIDVHKVLF